MKVFLSYSRRDERLVADTAALLSAAGVDTRRFEFIEYLGERSRPPVQCRANIVFYSQRSRITDAVRLSHYLARMEYQKLVLVDESWDQDPQASRVFSEIARERIVFEASSICERLRVFFRALRTFATPALSGPALRGAGPGDQPVPEHSLTTAELMLGNRLKEIRRPSLKEIAESAPPELFSSVASPNAQPSLRALLQKKSKLR